MLQGRNDPTGTTSAEVYPRITSWLWYVLRIKRTAFAVKPEKLIPAERLRAVPHATLSIEAKNSGKK